MSSESMINRENYELYFLDFLEGSLDAALIPQFRKFLLENPHLAAELQGMDKAKLSPDKNTGIVDKKSLRKKVVPVGSIHSGNIEEKMLAALEGELDNSEQQDLEKFLDQNIAYRYDYIFLRKTKLVADNKITYPGKEGLKHRPVLIYSRRFQISLAAAAMAFLFIFWRIFLNQPNIENQTLEISWISPISVQAVEMARLPVPVSAVPRIFSIPDKSVQVISGTIPGHETETALTLLSLPFHEITTRGKDHGVHMTRIPVNVITSELMAEQASEEKSSLVGKILHNLGQKVKSKGEDLRSIADARKHRNLDFWGIADLGVKGYNKLTDRNVELEVRKDEYGKTSRYSFTEEGRVLLSRSTNPH